MNPSRTPPLLAPQALRPSFAPAFTADVSAGAECRSDVGSRSGHTSPATSQGSPVDVLSPASSAGAPGVRDASTQTDSVGVGVGAPGLWRPDAEPRRLGGLRSWVRSNQALALASGVAVGAAAFACAPQAWPTTSCAYNRALTTAGTALATAGAVLWAPELPYRLCGAAFAGLLGAALAIQCAPCIMPGYLAGVTFVSAGFGYKASQHVQSITTALMLAGGLGAVWWAASIVGPRFGVAVPSVNLAT